MRTPLILLLLLFAASYAQAGDIADELASCRTLEADGERLICYDAIGETQASMVEKPAVAESAPQPSVVADAPPAADPAPERTPVPAPEPTPVPAVVTAPAVADAPVAEEQFGKSAGQIRREQEASFGGGEIREIQGTVVELRTLGNYKIEMTLDNGQTWRQVSSSYLKLKKGDKVAIKRAALDSFRLVKVGNNRAMKVRRVD